MAGQPSVATKADRLGALTTQLRSKGSDVSSESGQLPRLVDIGSIAEHLGVKVRHVRQLVAERRIPYVKWGKLLRFDPREVSAWIAERRVEPL
jgi:excisionase family DNA binding protein